MSSVAFPWGDGSSVPDLVSLCSHLVDSERVLYVVGGRPSHKTYAPARSRG